jgi:hypothetical protein
VAKRKGRPPKEFTTKERAEIEKLAGFGLTHDQIAIFKKCDRNTLVKHCSEELERGKIVASITVIEALFSNIKLGDPASIFFYLKTQCHWREKDRSDDDKDKDKDKLVNQTINLNFLPKPE